MKTEQELTDLMQGTMAVVDAAMPSQGGFEFPQPLTEKYAPSEIDEFIGLEKVKNAMRKLAAKPYPSSWFFLGKSGTGKTRMAIALARAMRAELHHVPSKECTLETVKELKRLCHYAPRMFDTWEPCRMHLVLIDEADQMSYAAQLAFLSVLDGSDPWPNTVIIFTGNSTDNLDPDKTGRFMSRVRTLEFSNYGISGQVTDLLQRVWLRETSNPVETPNFARIVKDASNNVRAALMSLETEIMCA